MSAEKKLKELNIILPNAPDPVGSYVASKIVGNLVFISGQISVNLNGEIIKGKVGKDIDLKEAQDAAKFCALNILAQIKKKSGNLDKVKNCIKLTGQVNSTNEFVDQPKVINSASEIISQILGEKGNHARAAVSVNSLPLGASVEIDAIFEI